MIQRVQTVFLALVVVLFVALLFIPVYQVNPATQIDDQANGNLLHNPLLLLPIAFLTLLAVIAIFMYKNRPMQIKICRAGLIISLLTAVNAIIFPQFFLHGIPKENIMVTNGAYLLPVNIILFALAAYRIKKDEDLVKAADRLR
ncbi:MAG: DUF4293 domain-containing protein [Bacteroidota bacterium]|nr:DUF4293 domain-containing protein [Bacteroidota bacterium]